MVVMSLLERRSLPPSYHRPALPVPGRAVASRLALGGGLGHRQLLGQLGRRQWARDVLDALEPSDLVALTGAQLAELARLGQYPPLERADRVVVGAHRLAERHADPVEMAGQRPQPLVQVPAEIADLDRAGREPFLLPAVGDG